MFWRIWTRYEICRGGNEDQLTYSIVNMEMPTTNGITLQPSTSIDNISDAQIGNLFINFASARIEEIV